PSLGLALGMLAVTAPSLLLRLGRERSTGASLRRAWASVWPRTARTTLAAAGAGRVAGYDLPPWTTARAPCLAGAAAMALAAAPPPGRRGAGARRRRRARSTSGRRAPAAAAPTGPRNLPRPALRTAPRPAPPPGSWARRARWPRSRATAPRTGRAA